MSTSHPGLWGIAGGIASGKSEVGRYLTELGYPVIDLDPVAKQLAEKDPQLIEAIKTLLGNQAYQDGKYQTQYVASQIFSNPHQKKALEALIHPKVRSYLFKTYEAYRFAGHPLVFCEAALIFETNLHELLEGVLLITTSPDNQLQRAKARNPSPSFDPQRIQKAQLSVDQCVAQASYVIENLGTIKALREKVDDFLTQLHKD